MFVMLRLALLLSFPAVFLGLTKADAPASIHAGLQPGLIAFVQKVEGGPFQIYLMNPDGSDKRFFSQGQSPRWSPDGTRLAFIRYDSVDVPGLYVANRDRGDMRRLATASTTDHAWSPDGREIAFSSASSSASPGLVVVEVESGTIRQLTHDFYVTNPSWSPRGRRIAFVRSLRRIATVNADGSALRLLTPRKFEAQSPEWSPDGRRIVFQMRTDPTKSDIWVMNGDGSQLRNLTRSDNFIEGSPHWSPNARRIAFVSSKRGPPGYSRQDIHAMRWDGSAQRNLTASGRFESSPAWSPGGQRLVFEGLVLEGVNSPRREIYVMTSDGRNVTQLTNDPAGTSNSDPVWSSK